MAKSRNQKQFRPEAEEPMKSPAIVFDAITVAPQADFAFDVWYANHYLPGLSARREFVSVQRYGSPRRATYPPGLNATSQGNSASEKRQRWMTRSSTPTSSIRFSSACRPSARRSSMRGTKRTPSPSSSAPPTGPRAAATGYATPAPTRGRTSLCTTSRIFGRSNQPSARRRGARHGGGGRRTDGGSG